MLDKETNQDLRERFNPPGSKMWELQMQLLSLLNYLDKVCTGAGINYWLSSGTCLGAMRHGGFIPWDDDLDVEMTEADYKKFLEIVASDTENPYVVQTRANDPGYFFQFGKLKLREGSEKENDPYGFDVDYRWRGLYIDIFVMTPSNSKFLHRLGYKLTLMAASRRHIKKPWLKKLHRAIIGTMVYNVALPILDKVCRIGAGDRLRHKMGGTFHSERFASDIFPIGYTMFEGEKLPIPGKADKYLQRMFGDWHQLPDLEKLPKHWY